jgi:hypothetical protein
MGTNHGTLPSPIVKAILKAEGLKQIAFAPLAADADWFKTSTAPTAGEDKTTILLAAAMTKAYMPGWPVVPVSVITDSSGGDITAVSAVIAGLDQFGDYREETVAHTDSSGTWTGTAVNAYETLISYTLTITGTVDGADRYVLGFAKTYGFGCKLGDATDAIVKLFNGSADAGTVSVPNSTYVIAGTPDASKELILSVRPSYYFPPK